MGLFKKKRPAEHEQRTYLRVNTVFPVEIRFVDKKSSQTASKTLQCFTRDISKGGLCLQLYSPQKSFYDYLDSNQYRMALMITPPFSRHPIAAFAQKAWYKVIKDQGIESVLIGVQYEDIIEHDRKRLCAYVNSLRRKPYELAILILLLLTFGAYISFYYWDASQQNKTLEGNISELQQSQVKTQESLSQLKKKEITLKGQLESEKKTQTKLKKEITTIALNQTDEKIEALINQLKKSNLLLKDNIENLNQELRSTRNQLLNFQNKNYGIHILGTQHYAKLNENDTLDIVTLNNTNTLIGKLSQTDYDIVNLNTIDGSETTLLPTEIASITSVKLIDYDLYHNNEQSEVVQEASKTSRDTRIDFLKKIEYDTFKYFTGEINKDNGLVKDNSTPKSPASISALGFALVSYCIASDKGWLDYDEAFKMTLKALKTIENTVEHKNGFYYHFVDLKTGQRVWSSEISSMDTALFIAGALTAGQFFKNSEISDIAQRLYERIDWEWMTNGKSSLAMGWKPELGFLPYYWHTYNESLLAYVLAIGSPTHPISKQYWINVKRPLGNYKDYTMVYSQTGSLFVYQYPHLFIDFKNINDHGLNHWTNTIAATYANRQFCIDHQKEYRSYGENAWGLTASGGPQGFKGYGAKPGVNLHDGTLSPSAAIGSLPLTPEISLPALRHFYDTYKNHLYGFYGFRDSFNLSQSWFSNKYIGINQGLSMLMIENYLTGFIWTNFMQTSAFDTWFELCIQSQENN